MNLISQVLLNSVILQILTKKWTKYASLERSAIARYWRAKIIKNVGDRLIFWYPRTSDHSNESAFTDVLECCITMIEAHDVINQKLDEEELPSLSYRISADYGRVQVARSATSQSDDLFGPIMNMCSKINSQALPNGVAIGDGLYQLLQSLFAFF
ncbi:MAG: adenylate/guanylate cyclase domain-containing protein [Candidatus Nitrosopolaris sp.]|jgi:class 3 adenylate cyclase